ncbi:RsmB/NOP family class I SAM-dependent RNA methyltransferase [Marinovum sp.]|uniref:RsmB/NOP family class I SAM-dependent RNA methyltransferase n=1 Tax=Marinovum sp. TaxID=2024839 RepID=UPI002B27094C|nr:transcription antitermination factor NusB [Marinovum sp.]
MAATARAGALWLLGQVLTEGRLLSELTGATQHLRLEPAERARAQRLTLETLRGLEKADRVLKPYLRKMPPPAVRNVLRLATVELCRGGDAHGVVNDAVEHVRRGKRTAAYGGMVNAVLRKVAVEGAAKWAELRVPHLPKWLRQPLAEAWGGDAVAAMEAVQFAGAPLDLTVKGEPEVWAERLGGEVLPTGSLRLTAPGQVSALPGFGSGDWWVQDAAAALPVRGLGDVSGLTVLDMCAAPGGKTLQLAAGGAQVTALDISEARLGRVHENLARTGLSAEVVAGDALSFRGGPFDAVVLDAPCSATGTIRRHPDLPLVQRGEAIGGLIELQAALLDRALSCLKPGGRLIYCTCSLLPDEGECQVDAALERHEGLRVLPEAFDLPGVAPEWRSSEGGLRLRPDYWAGRGGMDGFYMACLGR